MCILNHPINLGLLHPLIYKQDYVAGSAALEMVGSGIEKQGSGPRTCIPLNRPVQ